MVLAADLIVGAIIGLACTIVLFLRANKNTWKHKFILIIFNGFLSGLAVYMGVVSIYFAFTGNLLFNQTNVVSQSVIALLGGITLMSVSFYYLFITKNIP